MTAPVTSPPATGVARPHDLPPGQRRVEGFPRFGTHLHRPPPTVPDDPVVEIIGAVTEPVAFRVADLATLPRREITADFHCVAGWSAVGLRWEGVAFETFYRLVVEPIVPPGAAVTHLVFGGLDGYKSIATLEDALGDDVMIADRLDGAPLPPDHGAPVRIVSPGQYGFISTKHLCRIELHTSAPPMRNPAAIRLGPVTIRTRLIMTHPRARVWHEERHPFLPAWTQRAVGRALIPPLMALCRLGGRDPK